MFDKQCSVNEGFQDLVDIYPDEEQGVAFKQQAHTYERFVSEGRTIHGFTDQLYISGVRDSIISYQELVC